MGCKCSKRNAREGRVSHSNEPSSAFRSSGCLVPVPVSVDSFAKKAEMRNLTVNNSANIPVPLMPGLRSRTSTTPIHVTLNNNTYSVTNASQAKNRNPVIFGEKKCGFEFWCAKCRRRWISVSKYAKVGQNCHKCFALIYPQEKIIVIMSKEK